MNNIEDGFYISPAFLDKMSIHIAKNFMDLPKIKVPLILGIWVCSYVVKEVVCLVVVPVGCKIMTCATSLPIIIDHLTTPSQPPPQQQGGKGQGKTFQCNLAYKKLGINPIVMSAGELESGNAGEPAKLIRQRYREASDIIKKGRMCSLFINDLDAGAGRMGESTQYTVNNQMVNATLMNIADNPTNVQLPGVYKNEDIPRVPIICTGNDFSTLYAPLIRDGRMEKVRVCFFAVVGVFCVFALKKRRGVPLCTLFATSCIGLHACAPHFPSQNTPQPFPSTHTVLLEPHS